MEEGGEDGVSHFALDKTKKGGRNKFISCHYVDAHVQLLSIAPQRRSRLSTTWQVSHLDASVDQVAAGGEGTLVGPNSRVRGNAEEKDVVLEERGAQEGAQEGVSREVLARKKEKETGKEKKVGEDDEEEEARLPETQSRCAKCKENHKGVDTCMSYEYQEEDTFQHRQHRCAKCKANRKGVLYCIHMWHVCAAVKGSRGPTHAE